MTRTYAARRLLEHGPLNFRELVEITGWPPRSCSMTLKNLKRRGLATCINHERRTVWRLV